MQFWLAIIDETQQASLTKCPEDYVVGLFNICGDLDDLLVGKVRTTKLQTFVSC
jgi:hypothetical protein